jgi:rhodanese-related sulfurtransferase
MEEISPQQVSERLAEGWKPFVLDVRSEAESAAANLAFTDMLCPHNALENMKEDIPTDRDILVYCAMGGRSAMACYWLEAHGFKGLHNLDGGIRAWAAQIEPTLIEP